MVLFCDVDTMDVCVISLQGESAQQAQLDDQRKPVYLFLADTHETGFLHHGRPDCHAHLPDNHRELHPPVCILLLQPAPPRLPHGPCGPPRLTHHHARQRQLSLLLLPLVSSLHCHPFQPPAAVATHHPPVSPAVPAPPTPPALPLPPFPR